ncbi:MAG TPA: hybrid sensor histidine kinase/response regulator [Myxococcales bacterium]|nr:hybrid sensor histidine kinase/response regulator [Myxococcales bacterium]
MTATENDDPLVPSVLLVDDRPENLLALEATLKPLKVRLVKARSGEEALLHLMRQTFAVILLDVQMPRLDGLQTAELIKQREQTRHIPIIFVTALSRETAYVFKGYAHGAVDYLLKPVDPEILRAKVRVFCDLFVRGEQIRKRALESEVKDVFFSSVVHELQTPLAAAKAQAQLALHQLGEAHEENGAARALRVISRQIDRLARLVGDLLDANRLESGQLQLNPIEFDLPSLLEDVKNRMQPPGDKHRIGVRSPERLSLFADRDRVDQVLSNLISNAIRYSPEGGPIEIAAERKGDAVEIAVVDHGVGIPRERQQTIFERFGRAQGPSFGGLGLGLAITKGIVEQHGGSIWMESTGKPGEGSRFVVSLPLAPRQPH